MTATAPKEDLHWFEKTVEYAFIIDHARQLAWASPLDGNHERAADAIFAIEGAKFLLIEFKRASGDFGSEEKKFEDYGKAKTALSTSGEDLHFFVFGARSDRGRELDVFAAPYWQHEPRLSVPDLLETKGCRDERSFREYVEKLIELKKKTEGSQGGPDYSFVAAVTREGEIQAISSLSEVFATEPSNEHTSTPGW